MQSIDAVKNYMVRWNYALYDGSIYKKVPEGKFTFVFCSSVHYFIHFTMGNSEVADQIVSQVTPIVNLLSESACRIIKPISLDFNFIEVTPYGTCFNIREKRFEIDPPSLKGTS